MPATATHDERLVGKLLVSTALVVISAAYGYWQKTLDVPRPMHSMAATPSPMPIHLATAASASGAAAATNDAAPAAAVTDDSAPAAANARIALADKPAASPVSVADAAVVQEGPAAAAIAMPAGAHLEDGEYTSERQDFQWGTVQVKAVIRGGAFTEIEFLQMPDHRAQSADLTDMAKPILSHETIHDQKSAVDVVSTATYTSLAYQDALADVIQRATRQ